MKRKLILALLTVPVVFGAFKVTDRVGFDRSEWVADFEQLKAEVEQNYANLKWARPSKQIDLVALNATTVAALQSAQTSSHARAALATFISGFEDNHFHIESGPPRPIAALIGLWPDRRQPLLNFEMSASEVCDALGFQKSRPSVAIEHPGFAEASATDFAAGVLTLENGKSFGLIRIPRFQQYDYGASCERAWQAFGAKRDGVCDESCQDEFYEIAKQEVAAQLARDARTVANGRDGLILDLTGNGGGTEWADHAAAALTNVQLKPPAVAFVRGDHWRRRFTKDVEAFTMDGNIADLAIARAMQDSAGAKCDLSAIWTNSGLAPACWNSVTRTPYATDNYFGALKQPNAYAGKLYILTDGRTASASELFSAILQDHGVATVIGTRTMGVGCGYTDGGIDIKLRNSGLKIVMPDCARMRVDGSNEYEGVQPDIAADWGKSDADKGAALAAVFSKMVD